MKFLTKGDNNNIDDRGLYVEGQLWLEEQDIIGRAKVRKTMLLSYFMDYCSRHSDLLRNWDKLLIILI